MNNFFLICFFFILILSFNIKFIRDWVSCFFSIFLIRLFWTHDEDNEFNGFTRVFPTFLIEFFSLDFILQHRVAWELDFVICFYLHFMRLSLSHDSGHWFSELTRVDSSCFLCHFLFVFLILSHPSMSSLLRIGFHNFF